MASAAESAAAEVSAGQAQEGDREGQGPAEKQAAETSSRRGRRLLTRATRSRPTRATSSLETESAAATERAVRSVRDDLEKANAESARLREQLALETKLAEATAAAEA